MVLLILSFVAGVLTVLAPCILPLLPVIIGGSISGQAKQKKRPYIIAISLTVSLLLFTLLLKASTVLIGIPPHLLSYISGGIILILGLVSLFPMAWDRLIGTSGLQAASQRLLGRGSANKGEYVGPVLTGAALGPVFSSCSPTYAFILATVLPRNFASGFIYLIAYSLGLVLVLLAIGIYGQRAISRFAWATNPHGWFKRIIGILFIIVGLSVISGYDKKAEIWLIAHLPNISTVEQKLFKKTMKNEGESNLTSTPKTDTSDPKLFNIKPTPAPELTGLGSWINSNPLTLAGLKGKVVLVDFWTYSCINCVRTLPYIEKWYETYKDKGFVVIGVHAPEFAFEHVEKNVQEAVTQRGLTYPIALDNDFATWNAYSNQYWPAHYLIDKTGVIRSVHFGEGDYDITEQAIQKLLGESAPLTSAGAASLRRHSDQTPETYFGTARAQNYSGKTPLTTGARNFQLNNNLGTNQWSLGGSWAIAGDKITSAGSDATLSFKVKAKDVYIVISKDGDQAANIDVTADNAGADWFGADVKDGKLSVKGSNLYHIASFDSFKEATLHLRVPPGVSLNAATFGG